MRQGSSASSESIFFGEWSLSGDKKKGNEKLNLTVTKIIARDSEESSVATRYQLNLLEVMQKNHREQTQIRKALNKQQIELERRSMDLGRPGYDKILREMEERQDMKKTFTFKEQTNKKTTLCQCQKRDDQFTWWCVQCKTTECASCTTEACYLGLEADHESRQVDDSAENRRLELELMDAMSCRSIEQPEFYEMTMLDFQASWRIMSSSTVVKQYR